MRWLASDEWAIGLASAASSAPRGGATAPGVADAEPTPIVTASASAAPANALPKRGTGLLVEEVQPGGVDRERNRVADAEIEPRREVRDQVRPRDDGAVAVALVRQLGLLGPLGHHLLRV